MLLWWCALLTKEAWLAANLLKFAQPVNEKFHEINHNRVHVPLQRHKLTV